MNFYIYLQEFQRCVQSKNGKDLSRLLTFQNREYSQSERVLNAFSEDKIATNLPLPWNDICIYHLNTCFYLKESNFITAYKEHSNLVQFFNKSISSMQNENWMLPVLNNLIRDLRLLALAADLEASIQKNDKHVQKAHVYLTEAVDQIKGLFRVTAIGEERFTTFILNLAI